jgi:hypothetical protein
LKANKHGIGADFDTETIKSQCVFDISIKKQKYRSEAHFHQNGPNNF